METLTLNYEGLELECRYVFEKGDTPNIDTLRMTDPPVDDCIEDLTVWHRGIDVTDIVAKEIYDWLGDQCLKAHGG